LYYNRFRYYNPESGQYVSQDPIRLSAGLLNFHSYVQDVNAWVDTLGLECAKSILDDVGPLKGKKKADIQQTLKKQGFSKTDAKNGGEVWTKAGSDGNTAAVRLDPASGKAGFADNVPHAHKEIVPSNKVVDGNYYPNKAKTFDDLGNQTSKTDWDANHIPIVE